MNQGSSAFCRLFIGPLSALMMGGDGFPLGGTLFIELSRLVAGGHRPKGKARGFAGDVGVWGGWDVDYRPSDYAA